MNAIARVNASRRLSPAALAFLKGFEWFVPYPYDDAIAPVKGVYREWTGGAVKGTLTIGYGHTNAAAHPLKIKPGIRISEAEAREILDVDLDPCEGDVRRMVTVPLTQGEFDACTDFDFNCGADNFANIARRLNAGDYAGARAALDLYVNPPVYRAGLQRRRDGEQALWDLPDPVSIAPRPLPVPAPVNVALPPRPEILVEDPATLPTVVAPPLAPEIPPSIAAHIPDEPVHHGAEVEPDHGLGSSRTVAGAGAAAAGGAGMTIDQASELAYQVDNANAHISAGTVLGLIVGLIILAGAGYALFARWDRGGRPLPAFLPEWLKRRLR